TSAQRMNRSRQSEMDSAPDEPDSEKMWKLKTGIRSACVAIGIALLPAAAFAQASKPADSDGHIVLDLSLVFVLICISGLFAMSEMAFVSVRRTRIDQLVDEGNRQAKMVAKLLHEPTRLLA